MNPLRRVRRYSLMFFALLNVYSLALFAEPNENPFPEFKLSLVVTDLNNPWAFVFLEQDKLLITEKSGRLLLVQHGHIQSWILGIPEVLNQGQGGLMDVALHPDYQNNGWIYLSYAYEDDEGNATRVIRGHLDNYTFIDQQIIFTASPLKQTPVHYGARLAFLPDNSLLITVGDGFDYREEAQRLTSQLGKIIRVNDDGSLPSDNPFASHKEYDPYIYSYGHRNPQGLIYDHVNNRIIAHEHGPTGGDEINVIEAGENYGWPVITKGTDYSGALISPYKTYPGMRLPNFDWTPSVAPSSMIQYKGAMFNELKGDLLISTLKSHDIKWLQMKDNQFIQQHSILGHLNHRIRDIDEDGDGAIYVLTDGENASLIKLTAKDVIVETSQITTE
ncbi:PQQ-dependent sugar dehydrogenase [Alteromonadaceae bacterium BrNp21-10]|nr:PQQ-dependent sugar dehydrogenase [Alteromonadaceae bacterium BrNp21-10]